MCMTYLRDHYELHHTEYISGGPRGFREKLFLCFFYFIVYRNHMGLMV